jgi:LysM repeat protein
VQRGDTLRGIAAQFDVSVQALLEANNLTPEQADALRVGQELVIP